MSLLHKILPRTGYPVAWVLNADGSNWNIAFRDVAALEKSVPYLDAKHLGVYFALGTVVSDRSDVPTGQKKEMRVESNVYGYRCVWADVDIGDDPKKHANQKEALTALAMFLRAVEWPTPTVVRSGTGLHLYWALDQDINIDDWRSVSLAMLAAARNVDFRIDPAAANKATQVLRPPGTHHRKDVDNPRMVTQLNDAPPVDFGLLRSAVEGYLSDHGIQPINTPGRTTSGVAGDIAAALGTTYTPTQSPYQQYDAPVNPKELISKCMQFREALTTPCSEPVWHGLLSTLMVFDGDMDGRALAHAVSSRDPRYDVDETDAKLDNLPSPALPFTCSTFEGLDDGPCSRCSERGKIKSPIVLGHRKPDIVLTTETPELAPPPPPPAAQPISALPGYVHPPQVVSYDGDRVSTQEGAYKCDSRGLWMVTPKDSDDGDVHICEQQVYALRAIKQADASGNFVRKYTFRIVFANGSEEEVIIDGGKMHTDSAYLELANYGVVIPKQENFKRFNNYMRAHANALAKVDPTTVHPGLGWQSSGDFVAGTTTVPAQGAPMTSRLERSAASLVEGSQITQGGDFATWRSIMDVFNTPDQMHAQFGVCTAFAAPLMEFVQVDGLTVTLQGLSGVGKSAIHDACASVWGNPKSMKTTAPGTGSGESLLSMFNNLGLYQSLPFVVEEISLLPANEASNFLHTIASGSEKARLTATGSGGYTRQVGGKWSTIVLASTNISMQDKLHQASRSHEPERYRVFEVVDLKPLTGDRVQTDGAILKQMYEHYGHAGVLYAKTLQANKANLKGWLDATIQELHEALESTQPERFWLQGMACYWVGAELARSVGLHSFNTDDMRRYILQQFRRQREDILADSDARNTLFSEMLLDLMPNTYVSDRSNELLPAGMTDIRPSGNQSIKVHIDVGEGVGWVSHSGLVAWCNTARSQSQLNLRDVLAAGKESGMLLKMSSERHTMTRGLRGHAGSGQVTAYKFKLTDADRGRLSDFATRQMEGYKDEYESE